MGKEHVDARVAAFIAHMWSKEAQQAKEAQEQVRAQTRQCKRHILCNGGAHVYGFVCDAWYDTVAALRSTRVPPPLLFGAHVQTWEAVDEQAVQHLLQRIASDVVFSMRLLDACAVSDTDAEAGQACVTAYLATDPWAPPVLTRQVPQTADTQPGIVEAAFVRWAARLQAPVRSQLLPHLFVWMHVFLVRSAQTHTFHPLLHGLVQWCTQDALALAAELLAPPLHCLLAPHLATMGLPAQCSPAELALHLPPTTCGGYGAFQAAVHTTATGGTPRGRAQLSRSRSPPRQHQWKGWTRMTSQSVLYPPMYLGPRGQRSFNVSD